jgi:hypothetical protein
VVKSSIRSGRTLLMVHGVFNLSDPGHATYRLFVPIGLRAIAV